MSGIIFDSRYNDIKKAREDAANDLKLLESVDPDTCFAEMISWSKEDAVTKEYLKALSKMGRLPNMGEYMAISSWIHGLPERLNKQADLEKNRAACSEFWAMSSEVGEEG